MKKINQSKTVGETNSKTVKNQSKKDAPHQEEAVSLTFSSDGNCATFTAKNHDLESLKCVRQRVQNRMASSKKSKLKNNVTLSALAKGESFTITNGGLSMLTTSEFQTEVKKIPLVQKGKKLKSIEKQSVPRAQNLWDSIAINFSDDGNCATFTAKDNNLETLKRALKSVHNKVKIGKSSPLKNNAKLRKIENGSFSITRTDLSKLTETEFQDAVNNIPFDIRKTKNSAAKLKSDVTNTDQPAFKGKRKLTDDEESTHAISTSSVTFFQHKKQRLSENSSVQDNQVPVRLTEKESFLSAEMQIDPDVATQEKGNAQGDSSEPEDTNVIAMEDEDLSFVDSILDAIDPEGLDYTNSSFKPGN